MTLIKELYDFMYADGSIWYPQDEITKITRKETDFLEEVLKLNKDASILDLGCGRGRHCIEFARRGYNVTGIDMSEKLIESAKKDALAEKIDMKFLVNDMRKINFNEEFDVALFMDVTFGIFDESENELLIKKVYQALKPGGQIFFVLFNPYYWSTHPQIRHWGDEDGEVVRRYRFETEEGSIQDIQIYICVNKGIRKVLPVQTYRAYTIPEMRRMCREAGLTTFVLYGDKGDFIPVSDTPFDAERSLAMYFKVRK